MPDALSSALATDGLIYLVLAYLVAGVVRGFTGFGTALIVVPVAGIYLGPTDILLMIGVTGIISNFLLVPDAWGQADRGEVAVLAAAAIIGVPIGVALLGYVDPLAVRWVVTVIAIVTLLAVISGWQWRGQLNVGGVAAIGSGAGIVGGMTALSGPVAIIFYLANARNVAAVRANMILFLGALDVLLISNVWLSGAATPATVWLGILVSVPYLLSISVGRALFDPTREKAYRFAAYAVVAGAVLTGLPLWE